MPIEQVRVAGRRHAGHALRSFYRREPLDDAGRAGRAARRRPTSAAQLSPSPLAVFGLPEEALTVQDGGGLARRRVDPLPRPDQSALRDGRRRADRARRGATGEGQRLLRRRARSSGRSASAAPRSRSIPTPAGSRSARRSASPTSARPSTRDWSKPRRWAAPCRASATRCMRRCCSIDTGTLLNAHALRVSRPDDSRYAGDFVSTIVENGDGPGPYGAKGVGEGSLAGVAAAIATALADAGIHVERVACHAGAGVACPGGSRDRVQTYIRLNLSRNEGGTGWG